MIQLLAVTCLSLGGKMDETEMPLILDMQVIHFFHAFDNKC